MVTAFAWPAARVAPRDVPVVVAGPQAAAVAERLDRERPGTFDVETRRDEVAARAALTGREAYGAIVTTPSGPKVLAASPVVAQQLGALAQNLARTGAAPPRPSAAGFVLLSAAGLRGRTGNELSPDREPAPA